jgi:hypothetical protein
MGRGFPYRTVPKLKKRGRISRPNARRDFLFVTEVRSDHQGELRDTQTDLACSLCPRLHFLRPNFLRITKREGLAWKR